MLSPAARFAFTLLELVEIIAIIGVALGFNRTWVQSHLGSIALGFNPGRVVGSVRFPQTAMRRPVTSLCCAAAKMEAAR
jgi:hypothetical protein